VNPKELDRFLADLERPFDGEGKSVTERDLEEDAESFIAFASAFGVKPPKAQADGDEPAVVPSS
jgi:hypothetical protein